MSYISIALKKLRILHITPWFPSEENPSHGIWIQRHIESLAPICDNQVVHMSLSEGKYTVQRSSREGFEHIAIRVPSKRWLIKEFVYFRVLKKTLKAHDSFDLINFHIAYPGLVFAHRLKDEIRKKIVITEHWSAYHFHFFSDKPLNRIKRIFSHGFPLITVSSQLHKDIEHFAGRPIPERIVPNGVNTSTFKLNTSQSREKTLLLGAYWKKPKRPFLFLAAAEEFLHNNPEWKVKIFGYGPSSTALEIWCEHNNQEYLGRLTPDQVAIEMCKCYGYVMPSDYETFSVGCAEALCCGTPILISDRGALPDHLHGENGIPVMESEWPAAIEQFTSKRWDNTKISEAAVRKYSYAAVGMSYFNALQEL